MENYEYSLDKSSKKYTCPECGRKTFVLYLNNNGIGKPLNSTVGKCDRADNCAHHYTPKQYFADHRLSFDTKKNYPTLPKPIPKPKPQPSFIDTNILKMTLKEYDQNSFALWLAGIVGYERASKAIGRYFVGTAKNGGSCFWQIDLQGKIRAGKIIVYGKDGHRRKDITPPVQWVHSVLKLQNFILAQCFFGEHLLSDATKTVAIVESEKTAIIVSIYFPEIIWLACGGSKGLSVEKCGVLKGRKVILYPDASLPDKKGLTCFDEWQEKAKELSTICTTVSVSSLIEHHATEQERATGFDLADYLVRFPSF